MTHTGSCHCGAVRFTLAKPVEQVTRCNCSICTKMAWRVTYCHPDDFTIDAGEDALSSYSWGDHDLDFRFCGTCGCGVHWRVKPEREAAIWPDGVGRKVGVNARMIDGLALDTIPVRVVDGPS